MAEPAKKAAPAKPDAKADTKPKRHVLTPAERVAKAEAELERLRAKAKERETKAARQLLERRSILADQMAERGKKISEIDAELKSIGVEVPGEPLPGV